MPSAEPTEVFPPLADEPEWAASISLIGDIGDYCGNCHRSWPCHCNDPVRICGVCGGDQHGCHCSERSGIADLPDWA
jgi:hypothetical protein